MNLYQISPLRKIVLPLLAKYGPGDIKIRHHYVGSEFHLHAFKHKGYWFHGKHREKATMALFKRLLQTGDIVVEVGGHIGYISLYFAKLVEPQGIVYVFEPGINNLCYLEKNIAQVNNVTLIKKAVSNFCGKATFYIENLTGQNNSLNRDYSVFQRNSKNAHSTERYYETEVEVVTLDNFLQEQQLCPRFVKIDIEGAELTALEGMQNALKVCKPMLMIEITENHKAVHNILTRSGYILFTEDLKLISCDEEFAGNTFCLHKEAHQTQLTELNLGSFEQLIPHVH